MFSIVSQNLSGLSSCCRVLSSLRAAERRGGTGSPRKAHRQLSM
jgi:hypothetical protein